QAVDVPVEDRPELTDDGTFMLDDLGSQGSMWFVKFVEPIGEHPYDAPGEIAHGLIDRSLVKASEWFRCKGRVGAVGRQGPVHVGRALSEFGGDWQKWADQRRQILLLARGRHGI